MAKPNILLITTDQQRFDTIRALGNPHIFTPHLDWLSDQGITYSRCYTDCPICMPARATIMTGQHGYTHGLTGNSSSIKPMEGRPTLPGILTAAGYQTRAVGKMHFHPLRRHYGFEHMEILPDYYRHMEKHFPHQLPKDHGVGENEMDPVISTVDDNRSLTHWTVNRSIDFLETRDQSRPFFLWTSFSKPHPPFDPTEKYWRLYEGIDMPLPVTGDWSREPDAVPGGLREATFMLNNIHRFSTDQLRAVRRAYYACISEIDYKLGLLFARMRELGLLQDTWIIFTSDHGEMLGDHHIGAKSIFLEGSAHVPMLIKPPGERELEEPAGTHCERIATLADILPTCLAMAEVDRPDELRTDGLNLLDLAAGPADRHVFIGQCGAYHSVIEGTYKFLFCENGGSELLFNLEEDPMEQHELLRTGQMEVVANHLRSILINHLEKQEHAAVVNGKLEATAPEPTAAEVRRRFQWPGFHSRRVDSDVMH